MTVTLNQFVARAVADDRILFGDLKRLQRDILPARITSREVAEILLHLDAAVHNADRDWTVYLTTNVRDFVVWGLCPAGSVNRDKAAWLVSALSRAQPARTARALIGEVIQEARTIDSEALAELGTARSRCRGRAEPQESRRHRAGPAGDSTRRNSSP